MARGKAPGKAPPRDVNRRHKTAACSALQVCAAPDCDRSVSFAFYNSKRSVVTKNKKAHALTRQPKVLLVEDSHICSSCYKLFCRRFISPSVSAARSSAWRQEQRAASAARSPLPSRQTRHALAAPKQSSLDPSVTTTAAFVAPPVANAVIAAEPPTGVVGNSTATASPSGAAIAIGAATEPAASAVNPKLAASIDTPIVDCCDDHVLVHRVLFANAYGWFSAPATFSGGPRAVCAIPSSREAYPGLDWDQWTQPADGIFIDDYYIMDTTSRVALIGDRHSLVKFLDSDHSSRQTLIACQKLELIYSRTALAPIIKRAELMRSTKKVYRF
jgi:hypothetical protein